ncbi:MAG: PrgI family protein [Faecalimonas sp.]|nr:PrgI family protein [Faecalimonas sp.]
MIVEINKDLEKYKESVAMGLTAKQLIFSIASLVVGGGLILLLYPYVGLTIAVYISIPVVAPIALGGFYSYQGMSFYEVMKRRFYFMFHNKPLTYVSTESVAEIDKWNAEQKLKEKNKRKRGKRV